jgi:hypothetical protein
VSLVLDPKRVAVIGNAMASTPLDVRMSGVVSVRAEWICRRSGGRSPTSLGPDGRCVGVFSRLAPARPHRAVGGGPPWLCSPCP